MGQQCTIPSLVRASKEIDLQVDLVEKKIGDAERIIRHYVEQAAHDPVAKQRALQAMKRKKMLEAQRQDLIGAQFNVDSLADQQEQVKFTLRAVDAMRQGHMDLKKDRSKMDIREVEEMLDATEDIADEMRAISESLARGSDQTVLENELLELQREYVPRGYTDSVRETAKRLQPSQEAATPPLPPPPPPPPARGRLAGDYHAELPAYGRPSHSSESLARAPASFSRSAVAA